jgi:hypothetical protein
MCLSHFVVFPTGFIWDWCKSNEDVYSSCLCLPRPMQPYFCRTLMSCNNMQLLRYGFWKNDAVLLGTQNISKEHAILHLIPLGGSSYVFLSTRMNGVTLQKAVVLTFAAKRAAVLIAREIRMASLSVSAHSGRSLGHSWLLACPNYKL